MATYIEEGPRSLLDGLAVLEPLDGGRGVPLDGHVQLEVLATLDSHVLEASQVNGGCLWKGRGAKGYS